MASFDPLRCEVSTENELLDAVADNSCYNVNVHGNIGIESTVLISRALYLKGATPDAAISQSNSVVDCIVIRDVAAGVTVSDLAVDARAGQVALVVANASNVAVTRTNIYGSASAFAVFFAGRKVGAGQASLVNFASRTEMDTNNSISDSIISSPWAGGSLSFFLQYLGAVTNNTVINGKIAALYALTIVHVSNVLVLIQAGKSLIT